MHTFKSEFIDGKKNILIPALQRDYVQGGRTDVINPFVNELLSALRGDKRLDLNYIYGSYEDDSFVPIDGQQRLITLWLVYLYLYKKQKKDFQVKLRFNSREFANAFSEKLLDKLQNFMNSVELKNDIIDAPWFVSGWQHDVTVCNMLNTLNLLAERYKEPNVFEYKNYDNISFSFLDIKNEGLTDDIYVKMNGRGKPLTYFENLKSWMDGTVTNEFNDNPDFVKNWQTKIDNEWTDFFWENRNKKQGHQEEIDDEQTRFFYSLLLLYWIKNEGNLLTNPSEDKKNGLNTFLGLSEDNKDMESIKNKIFEILREGKILIPLYWIEEIGLYNKVVFEFISEAFANLCYLNSEKLLTTISSPNEYLDLDKNEDDETTLMHKLSMANATYAKTLPYLYALIKTPKLCKCKEDENFKRWLRLIRNLVVNSKIQRDNLAKVCNCIDTISKSIKQDFYTSISNLPDSNGFEKEQLLDGFEKYQLKEEIEKAEQILNGEPRPDGKLWEEIIVEAEKYAFFKGTIRFLFRDGTGNVDWGKFDVKFGNAQKYFDENGVKDNAENYKSEVILMKAFLSRLDNIPERMYIFDNSADIWRNILTHKSYLEPVNDILMGHVNVKESDNKEVKRLCQDASLLKFLSSEPKFKWTRKLNGQLYPDYGRESILLDYDQRDVLLLCSKSITIINKRFEKFILGYHINFCYADHNFEWNHNNIIYLMNSDWGYILKVPENEKSNNDLEDYYCFKYEPSSNKSFSCQLNVLINSNSKMN